MKLSEIVKSFNFQREFAQQLIQEVLNLAKKYPNFIYNPTRKGYCVYNGPAKDIDEKIVGPECKGCIFGQALQNMGWNDLDEMKSPSSIEGLLRIHGGIKYMEDLNQNPDDPSRKMISELGNVQINQDEGKSWSQAASNILKYFKNQENSQ